MAEPQDDEKDEEWMKEVYGKEYTGPPKPSDFKDRDNNTMKKRSASDDESEDEKSRDPNAIPTGFTSREAKMWESKAKSIERNWKRKKEEELTCRICGEKGHFTQETDLHTKRTGHSEFTDKTEEAAKPIDLESKSEPLPSSSEPVAGEDIVISEGMEMVVPEVNKEPLAELEAMGFPTARATRALHFSGNDDIEAAVNWVVENENDPETDHMPMVPTQGKADPAKPTTLSPEEIKAKTQELQVH